MCPSWGYCLSLHMLPSSLLTIESIFQFLPSLFHTLSSLTSLFFPFFFDFCLQFLCRHQFKCFSFSFLFVLQLTLLPFYHCFGPFIFMLTNSKFNISNSNVERVRRIGKLLECYGSAQNWNKHAFPVESINHFTVCCQLASSLSDYQIRSQLFAFIIIFCSTHCTTSFAIWINFPFFVLLFSFHIRHQFKCSVHIQFYHGFTIGFVTVLPIVLPIHFHEYIDKFGI